jgi:hypothetical protein
MVSQWEQGKRMITINQKSYLESLLIDNSLYFPSSQRLEYLNERCGRPIHGIDELMKDEASRIIDELKNKKEREQKMRGQEERLF